MIVRPNLTSLTASGINNCSIRGLAFPALTSLELRRCRLVRLSSLDVLLTALPALASLHVAVIELDTWVLVQAHPSLARLAFDSTPQQLFEEQHATDFSHALSRLPALVSLEFLDTVPTSILEILATTALGASLQLRELRLPGTGIPALVAKRLVIALPKLTRLLLSPSYADLSDTLERYMQATPERKEATRRAVQRLEDAGLDEAYLNRYFNL